jgi:hypothetical protein
MKKTYTTPRLLVSGNAIRDTLIGTEQHCESDNQTDNMLTCAGGVGYNL